MKENILFLQNSNHETIFIKIVFIENSSHSSSHPFGQICYGFFINEFFQDPLTPMS